MFLDARAAFKVTRNLNTLLCLHGSVLWRGYMAWNSYLCKQQMQANEKRIITMNRSRVFIYICFKHTSIFTHKCPPSCEVVCARSAYIYIYIYIHIYIKKSSVRVSPVIVFIELLLTIWNFPWVAWYLTRERRKDKHKGSRLESHWISLM